MAPLIAWRKEFETGIPDVDHEHRELVDLINALHDQIKDGPDAERIQVFLGEVFAKIAAHFALEESIMRGRHYDEYEVHKTEHERLLDEIRDIMDAVTDGSLADYHNVLSETVRDWFVGHFQSKDVRLHKKLGF
jgi:hemerythrin-like metal-binding protein